MTIQIKITNQSIEQRVKHHVEIFDQRLKKYCTNMGINSNQMIKQIIEWHKMGVNWELIISNEIDADHPKYMKLKESVTLKG